MKVAWIKLGGTACIAVMALLNSAPVKATDQSGMTTVAAEELDRRSRQPEEGETGGLSESAVRVMVTYAFSLIPDETQGPDGPVKVDKSDPNKYVIPSEDARRVIRAATRSAYADVCGLPELGQANYKAMLAQEEARKTWTREQLLMIEALHLFAMSYFTGNAKITDSGEGESTETAQGDGATNAAKGADAAAAPREVQAPPPPKCPPEQKQKVENAINAYVAEAQAN